MTTDEVVEAVEREYARLLAAVDALGQSAETVAVTDEGWTPKDVLGHCIHWAAQLAWGLGAPLEVPAYVVGVEGRPSEEEWNDRAVVFYRDLTMVEVRARLDAAVSAVLERARLRSDEQMSATDAIPWGGGRPLWEQIGGETFNHWPRPVEGIEAALRNRQQRR